MFQTRPYTANQLCYFSAGLFIEFKSESVIPKSDPDRPHLFGFATVTLLRHNLFTCLVENILTLFAPRANSADNTVFFFFQKKGLKTLLHFCRKVNRVEFSGDSVYKFCYCNAVVTKKKWIITIMLHGIVCMVLMQFYGDNFGSFFYYKIMSEASD